MYKSFFSQTLFVPILIIILNGCVSGRLRAPFIETSPTKNISYSLTSGSIVSITMDDGVLQHAQVTSPNGLITFELKESNHQFVQSFYNDDNIITSTSIHQEPHSRSISRDEYYSNGETSYQQRIIGRDTVEYFFQLDGTPRDQYDTLTLDTIKHTWKDSLGKLSSVKWTLHDTLIEQQNFDNDTLIMHRRLIETINDSLSIFDTLHITPLYLDSFSNDYERRSKSSIMNVVRKNTPRLRDAFNAAQNNHGDFLTKLYIKFTIGNTGEIIRLFPSKYSRQVPEAFITQVCQEISHWRFGTIKKGNTTVTIPFTFSQ